MLFSNGISQVVSDFETDIDGWYSEGDGDYVWEIGTGNPGNNFRVNDDATGDINLSYAPNKFLGNWSGATTSDYISADIFHHKVSGGYAAGNFVFQIQGPGGIAKALEGTNPTLFDQWLTYTVNLDPGQWNILSGTWAGILQNVNELIIRMEYINGDEWNRSDNLALSFTPVVVPVVPVICSDFEEGGYDGWSFTGNGSVSNQSSGGNPGHYIRINNGSGTAVALAPPKFLGDWSQIDNHNAEIHVDLNITGYTGNPIPGDFFINISGPDGEANFPMSSDISLAYDDWHTMTVPLDETQWTMVSGTWAALINNVNSLQLNLEYFDGSETVYMDNFCITDLPPVADFDSDITTILPGNEITFNDLSINGPTSWNWDFGDLGTSAEKNPVHTYYTPGIYDITLTVSNHFGSDMTTQTAYIEVLDDAQCTHYEDNFDNSPISTVWNFRNGTWSLYSGYLRQTSNYYVSGNYLDGCYAIIGNPAWQDYIINCDFKSTDNDVIGFVFNYQDEENLYMFLWRLEPAERKLIRWENGVGTILVEDVVPYSEDQWYHAEIATISGNISIKIDGFEVFYLTDNTYTDGLAGLYCWGNQQSHYDNFRLGCEGVQIDLTAFLEGSYDAGTMSTQLKDNNLLPLQQPYSGIPWNYAGYENLASIPDASISDWVLIEIRDAPDAASALPSTKVGQKTAFILDDGSVVDLNGSSPLRFSIDVQDQLFAVIRHRNHLPVMSASPLSLSGGIYEYDFTIGAGQAYGTDAQKNLGNGYFGLFAGDVDANGSVENADKIIWTTQAGTTGYQFGDFTLDGQADNEDKNDFWKPNLGNSCQVPQ